MKFLVLTEDPVTDTSPNVWATEETICLDSNKSIVVIPILAGG